MYTQQIATRIPTNPVSLQNMASTGLPAHSHTVCEKSSMSEFRVHKTVGEKNRNGLTLPNASDGHFTIPCGQRRGFVNGSEATQETL